MIWLIVIAVIFAVLAMCTLAGVIFANSEKIDNFFQGIVSSIGDFIGDLTLFWQGFLIMLFVCIVIGAFVAVWVISERRYYL